MVWFSTCGFGKISVDQAHGCTLATVHMHE